MSFSFLKNCKQYKIHADFRIISRFKSHINHPGRKAPKLCIEPKIELPDEYTDDPQYPPVKPKYPTCYTFPANYSTQKAWHYYSDGQKYNSLRTIQERLAVIAYLNIQPTIDDLGVTRIRHYPLLQLATLPSAAQSSEQRQYITKTALNPQALEASDQKPKDTPAFYKNIKNLVIESILTNSNKNLQSDDLLKNFDKAHLYQAKSVQFEENLKCLKEKNNSLTNDIFNTISTYLVSIDSAKYSHLCNAQYGRNVPIEAYWKRCGYKETKARGCVQPDDDVVRFQYRDKALYQIKTDMPLKPIFGFDELDFDKMKIPEFNYHPAVYKIFGDHTLPMQVPGHWFGDPREFNYLTVHDTTDLLKFTNVYGDSELNSALESMVMTSAHAELTAQAYYLGFSMWNDLTYPLVGQFVYTDGQKFSIAKYQLNTLQLWNPGAPLKNICYLTELKSLYELNDNGTSIKEFNDELFAQILNVFENKPVKSSKEIVQTYSELDYKVGGTPLRPYLSVQDFNSQLSKRRQLLATTLYELVKYDRPATYLQVHNTQLSKNEKPKFPHRYNKITFAYRDIVREYYPREYHGYGLIKMSLKVGPEYKPKYWDILEPVYEWASIPPPHTNNIKRDINLPTF